MRQHLQAILDSPDFDASRRSRDFLRFIVDETLAGRGEALTQASIATRVFERRDDFDALIDPIVRIQAGRLRRSLERYYMLGGKDDPLRIELPKGTYVPVFRGMSAAETAGASERARATETDSWPSLTVSLFQDGGSGAGHEEVAAHAKDELRAELGRYRDVRILQGHVDPSEAGREARFDLRGRLNREGDGWRVSVQLADRTTGEQIWAEVYRTSPTADLWSGPLDEIARVIAARVGGEHGAITQALMRAIEKRPADEAGLYGAILRSNRFFFSRQLEDLAPAAEGLRRLVAEQPQIALAWSQLARLSLINHAFELSEMDTPIDEAVTQAYQAVRLDPPSARFRCTLAAALLVKGELEAGRDELEPALRLNPGSLVYLEMIGWLLAALGDWERGIAVVREAMRRNPHHLPHAHFGLWADHLRRGEIEAAYQAALAYRDPTGFWRSVMRACCLGHLERLGEARAEVEQLVRQKPDFPARGRTLIGYFIKPPELVERVVAGLAEAGLALS